MPPRAGSEVGCRRIPVARGKRIRRLYIEFVKISYAESVPGQCNTAPGGRRLEALFPTTLTFRQVLHLLFVDLDLPRLLHLLPEVRQEHAEEILLFVVQEAIADLIFFGGEVLFRGLLLFEHGEHDAVGSGSDGTADLAG